MSFSTKMHDFGQQKLQVEMEPDAEAYALAENMPGEQEGLMEDGTHQEERRRSQRSAKGRSPVRFGFDKYADLTEVTHAALSATTEEPATIEEAWGSKHSAQWRAATDSE